MSEPDSRDPRLDAAYRDAATDEPPAAIDERIRAAARRAVAAGPQSLEARARAEAQRSWIARWRVPVSIAATVVVAVTLSYMVQDETVKKAPIDGLPRSTSPQAVAVAPVEDAKAPVPAAAQTPDLAQVERAAKVASQRGAAADTKSANLLERDTTERPPSISAPARADGPAANGMLAKEAERRQAAGELASPASPPPPQARIAPAETHATPAAAASAPPPAPMAKPAPARDLAEPAGRDRAFADRPGRMERGAASYSAEQKPRTPEEWLEELRRLKAAGRTDELAKELVEFRKRFPDYKLPADLVP
jgi:hypothetical protein